MKKIIATTATAALLLMAASPALAQDAIAVDDSVATGGDVSYLDASQAQFALQAQFGDANAIGDENVAYVSTDQGITQNQANAGRGEINDLTQSGGNILFLY